MIKDLLKIIRNAIIEENAVFGLVLGLCPALAVSTNAVNSLGMGIAFTFVQTCSALVVSLVRKTIIDRVRIPVFLAVIAGFVTITDLTLKAYFPDLAKSLGVFVPLIVVNCIVLGRAEVFYFKNPPLKSLADGIGMGIGFTFVLVLIGGIREIFGEGKIFGLPFLSFLNYQPMGIAILPPGGFILIGIMMAAIAWYQKRQALSEVVKAMGGKPEDIIPEEAPDEIKRADMMDRPK